jgi:hypothetical protein
MTPPLSSDLPLALALIFSFSAARVDLAQYAALAIEEHLSLTTDLYREGVLGIGKDLSAGIKGLTAVMEYFSRNGQVENLPLSVYAFPRPPRAPPSHPICGLIHPWFDTSANSVCSLGYVGMPLILAAIDLKLSPSCDEMKIRQKRLDSLSKIIRLSESLYDVTDFVAAGTNHILQLAYVTTQNFFLPSGHLSKMITDREERDLIEKRINPDGQNLTGARTPTPIRAKSWLDAFFRCPRAYLLISTSVDYSLAVGRLPYDTSLPALVREIPAMGSITQLPWTIDTSLNRGTSLYANRGRVPSPSELREGSVNSKEGTSAANTQGQEGRTMIHDMPVQQSPTTEGKEWDENNAHINDPQRVRIEPRVPNLEESYEPITNAVNLDFLDLDVSLDGEGIIYYDSSMKPYDNVGSLPIGIMGERDTRAGRLGHMGIDGGLNTGFTSEGLDPILFDPLFHDSSGGGYFNV